MADRTVVVVVVAAKPNVLLVEYYLKRTNLKPADKRLATTGCVTRCLHESVFLISSFSQASRDYNVLCKFKALRLIYICVTPCLM